MSPKKDEYMRGYGDGFRDGRTSIPSFGRLLALADPMAESMPEKQRIDEFVRATIELVSGLYQDEPAGYFVHAEPDFRSYFVRTKKDAERTAHNYMTYVNGCTGATIEPLFASGKSERVEKRTYGI